MTNWDDLVAEPVAPLVGPFPRRPFLEAWRAHRPSGDLVLVATGEAVMPIVVDDGVGRFAGEAHLTDYHSPLGTHSESLAEPLVELQIDLVLDSLPAEAADPLESGLRSSGAVVSRDGDGACQVLDLPQDPGDGWESMLGSKERHEIRRKRRRAQAQAGTVGLEEAPGELTRFVEMHRQAAGDKGGFMTEQMAGFFESLLRVPGARLDVLRRDDGEVVAGAFGFEDDKAYYLYNSAFDQSAAAYSPGIVMIDLMISRVAHSGRRRFDFLKGSETYKRRLGATERPLYRIGVTR